MTGELLGKLCDPAHDFIGHIGGDDFIILFRSADWEERCQRILDTFSVSVTEFFSPDDRERGGYFTEDRQGKRIFHPLASLSLGAVEIKPEIFTSLHQVAGAAGAAKKQAKKTPGNSLFVERRIGSA
jgi:GGDEF domain-containing protein